jgi:pimeloyl-ACP methyl ester carboxylesterase
VPTFRADGLTLHYDARGSGHPVVLLHGFTSRASSWERHGWVDLLVSAGLRAIVPDARSHGRSDRVFDPAACTTEVLASDVVALLDELEIPHASLFGFSMGGGTALRVAMDWPARVTRLAVAGVGDPAINDLHEPAAIAELAEVFAADSADVVAGTSPVRIRRNAELAGNDVRALRPFLQQGGWPGGLRDLSPVYAPTLVVLAGGDEYMADANALVARLAPTKVVRLPGEGHYEVLQNEAVKREVVAFLARDAVDADAQLRS